MKTPPITDPYVLAHNRQAEENRRFDIQLDVAKRLFASGTLKPRLKEGYDPVGKFIYASDVWRDVAEQAWDGADIFIAEMECREKGDRSGE